MHFQPISISVNLACIFKETMLATLIYIVLRVEIIQYYIIKHFVVYMTRPIRLKLLLCKLTDTFCIYIDFLFRIEHIDTYIYSYVAIIIINNNKSRTDDGMCKKHITLQHVNYINMQHLVPSTFLQRNNVFYLF